jgi:hypothetical protein
MNYSQKIQNKANDIQHLSDAFEEVRITLDVLTRLEMTALGDKLGGSIQKIVFTALEEINAIECKIDTDYTEKV